MGVPGHYSPGACFIVQNICTVDGLTARNGYGILHTDSPLLRVSVLCSNSIVPRGGGRRQYTGFLAWRQAENPFVMPVSGHFIGAIFPARYYYSIKIRRGPLRGPHNAPQWVPAARIARRDQSEGTRWGVFCGLRPTILPCPRTGATCRAGWPPGANGGGAWGAVGAARVAASARSPARGVALGWRARLR